MHAKRFNLKTLFLSTTLISFGLAMAMLPVSGRMSEGVWYLSLVPQLLWLSGGALIGGGMLLPFLKPEIGAVLGFTVQVVVFYVWFIPISSLF